MPAQSVTVELYLNSVWTAITSYVRYDPGVSVRFGVQQENSVADPSECRITVNNRDGRFTPRNTAGAYYPYLKRGTPLRVLVAGVERFRGELVEYPVRWDPSGADARAELVAAGIMRRLARANGLDSPMLATIKQLSTANANIQAYWPLEDRPGTTSPQPVAWLTSVATRPAGGVITGAPVWQAVDPGVMSDPIPTWKNARATFTVPASAQGQFNAQAVVTFPSSGLTGGEELFRITNAGTATSWRVLYSGSAGGTVILQVIDYLGNEILAAVATLSAGLDGGSTRITVHAKNNGGSVDYFLGLTGYGAASGTIAATSVDAVTDMRIGSGTIAIGAEVAIGHLAVSNAYQGLSSVATDAAWVGYAGESVEQRAARLQTQTGIPIAVVSGNVAPVELGAQSPGSLLDVLREMEAADVGGILRDSINGIGITYRTRWSRYDNWSGNTVALNYASGHLTVAEPTDDDANLRNDVTVQRTFGSSARAEKTSGTLSVLDYPNGVGRYAYTAMLSTYSDAALPYVAQWLLGLGTVDETRWPRLTVDLAKNPSLATAVEALRPGDEITVTNLPAYAGATSATLQVVGWTEDIDTVRRTVTLNCVPGDIWHVMRLNSATYGILDVMRLAL